ncbi:hypothetical protein PQC55_gp085 [Escherichia phage vB_EcoP-CHD5UKE1]|jgi:hypothetical protein|uniref:Uncharacterized protein n=21 Tax=Kuravirus TaxID=680277 RepID=B0FIP4_BPE32|nr:hypothetical protein phi32_82 [Escherichia phage phiEco32]YP_006906146.1 hypothetical protein NJ01_098 [Escherichia phage NJ01]YP_009152935.1 hypothetical protein ACQ52_gp084 [Escherichia phage vB_EcoP_SU10]YP_009208249.1 hypothetical protein AVV18_gp101 [Escherichia phage 172-1]YP_010673374.1 hypothetical protein PQC45_gp082 [Escherichia phage ES17]YP_010673615.1 glutamine amidotransferase [Escherichia phage vB_EcoP_EcoN5]YP_010673738.1 hypothetical protein PQC48_gp076 [Escherichia phage 
MEIRKMMLDNVVTTRRIPMTSTGCDNLRAIQKWMQAGIGQVLETQVEVPFPTVINNVLADYVKIKGIKVEPHVKSGS